MASDPPRRLFPIFERRSKASSGTAPKEEDQQRKRPRDDPKPNVETEAKAKAKAEAKAEAKGEAEADSELGVASIPRDKRLRMNRNRLIALAAQASKKAADVVQAAKLQARGSLPPLSALLLEPSWSSALSSEFDRPYFSELERFVHAEWRGSTPIYPAMEDTFRALNSSAFEDVKVVILGQDPYHGEKQAMGLSFSVQQGIPLPSSLQNIFKELRSDLGIPIARHGDLSSWSAQGVLLLNTVLSVFTDAAIKSLVRQRTGVVFVLWGKQAQLKSQLIDVSKHHILQSAHPSGLSAHRGFFGSRPFSKINEILAAQGKEEIEWDTARR